MVECEFCGEEFSSETVLHVHWGKEHAEELTSHQQDTVKKARREQQREKRLQKRKNSQRKKRLGYGLAVFLGVAFLVAVGSHFVSVEESPTQTSSQFDIENQPVLGAEDAPVTVVEFGDYRCPFCKQFETNVVPRLKTNYIETGKVKLVFINFPFLGPGSTEAAIASECVLEQNETAFWSFHHALYRNQGDESEQWVTTDLLLNIAKENTEGVDVQRLKQCIRGRETQSAVAADRSTAQANGVDSTPTVFVNDQQVQNRDYNGLTAIIDRELDNGN
jgi:protein-disulfide isomerase